MRHAVGGIPEPEEEVLAVLHEMQRGEKVIRIAYDLRGADLAVILVAVQVLEDDAAAFRPGEVEHQREAGRVERALERGEIGRIRPVEDVVGVVHLPRGGAVHADALEKRVAAAELLEGGLHAGEVQVDAVAVGEVLVLHIFPHGAARLQRAAAKLDLREVVPDRLRGLMQERFTAFPILGIQLFHHAAEIKGGEGDDRKEYDEQIEEQHLFCQ